MTPAPGRRVLGALVAGAGLAGIAGLTLRSNSALSAFVGSTPLSCIICGDSGVLDFILNILFFAPLGLGLYLAGLRPAAVIAMGAALSLTVEAVQLRFLVGRDASLGDLLSNTMGTALGVVVARGAWSSSPLHRSAGRWRLAAALGVGTAGLALGGWSLMPSASRAGSWHARTAFEAPDAVSFRGRIAEFRVGREIITAGAITDPMALRSALDLPVRVVTVRGQGALVADPQAWLALLETSGQVQVSIGQEWCAFTYLGRQRSSDLRLHAAGIYVDGPCRASLADSFRITARQSSSRIELGVRDVHGERAAGAPLYLATGWISFWPYADHLIPRRPIAEIAWIALLLMPAGIWLAPAAIGMLATVALTLGGVALLFGLTAVLGLSSVQPLHMVAVPLGIAAGALARLVRRGVLRHSEGR